MFFTGDGDKNLRKLIEKQVVVHFNRRKFCWSVSPRKASFSRASFQIKDVHNIILGWIKAVFKVFRSLRKTFDEQRWAAAFVLRNEVRRAGRMAPGRVTKAWQRVTWAAAGKFWSSAIIDSFLQVPFAKKYFVTWYWFKLNVFRSITTFLMSTSPCQAMSMDMFHETSPSLPLILAIVL